MLKMPVQSRAGPYNPERLMAAMQGANVPGADSRCLARGTSSTSAFLRVYRPDDTANEPYLNLSILEMPFGEEPIDSLQRLFDVWQGSTSTEQVTKDIRIDLSPNPVHDVLHIDIYGDRIRHYVLVDQRGKEILIKAVSNEDELFIDLANTAAGVYIIDLKLTSGDSRSFKIIKE